MGDGGDEKGGEKKVQLRLHDIDAQSFALGSTAFLLGTRLIQHPMLVVKTQIQVRPVEEQSGFRQVMRSIVERDGARGLYRGLRVALPATCSSLLYVSILESSTSHLILARDAFREAIARDSREPGNPSAVRGSSSPSSSWVEFFVSGDGVVAARAARTLFNLPDGVFDMVVSFCGGAAAATVAAVVSTPLDIIAQREMMRGTGNIPASELGRNEIENARGILAKEGMRGLFRGVAISAAMSAQWSGMWWGTYSVASSTLLPLLASVPSDEAAAAGARDEGGGESGEHAASAAPAMFYSGPAASVARMLSGATAGAVAAFASAPLDVARTRLQVLGAGGESGNGVRAAGLLLWSICRQEGIRGLFRGMGARLTAVLPVSAIIAEAYDFLKRFNINPKKKNNVQ